MKENQLPVHHTSAEETGTARPAVDDDEVHISSKRATDVEARPTGNYLADDLSKSVQITLAHFSPAGSTSATSAASAVAVAPLRQARNSNLRTWLLVSAVITVTLLYIICNPKSAPSPVKISKQQSADISKGAHTARGGTAAVAGAVDIHGAPSGRNSASVFQPKGETGNHAARSNDRDSGSGGAMPKAAQAKTSKPETRLMVPPPPAPPYVLPPASGLYTMQPDQQDSASQASLETHNQDATRENTPQQATAVSGTTDAALDDAEQELQAALKSSLSRAGEWKR